MKTTAEIQTGGLTPARREFLKKTGAATIMSMFGVHFFTGCSTDDPDPRNPPASNNGISVVGNVITIDLAVATALASSGGWALVVQAQTLIVNLGSNTFSALTSVCTHEQCDRNWTFSSDVFSCTCHGSSFNTSGAVVTGPATQPLRSYATSLNGNILTITKS